jgi:hypothetical protein
MIMVGKASSSAWTPAFLAVHLRPPEHPNANTSSTTAVSGICAGLVTRPNSTPRSRKLKPQWLGSVTKTAPSPASTRAPGRRPRRADAE